ncbi:MAG: DUF6349 family protein [Nocardioidaceae bacterium]|nr:DUF6349 family protein [Nocardioidaceae bacterium]
MSGPGEQLAFDFVELEREEAREHVEEWSGAPLGFTTAYYSPDELEAAFEHWCLLYTHFDAFHVSHMWHRFGGDRSEVEFGAHRVATFSASLSPERGAEGPGELLHQAVCEPCEWNVVSVDENTVVEHWHDHAVPDWRELPVVPAEIRVRNERGLTKLARAWIEAHYPAEMQVPGAPIITERMRSGTRHVAGYSPWNGFDLSFTALGREPIDPDDDALERDRAHLTRPGRTETGRAI